MKSSRFGSLSSRLTLSSLAVLLLAICALAFFFSRTMQKDMQRAFQEQQSSSVSVLAAEVEQKVMLRLESLQQVASNITSSMLSEPTRLQAYLDSKTVLKLIFNTESFITAANGSVLASVPSAIKLVGVNLAEREYFIDAMNGKATISRPLIGKVSRAPVFVMAVPIRDAQGRVIAMLAGGTDLAKENFLDELASHTYGKTGGYALISPQNKLIVTASDKRLAMSDATIIDRLVKRFMQGDEGSGVFVNPVGVEMLASVKAIPKAGWLLMAELPTAEAFAPIYLMQRRILLVAFLLSLLASALIFWLIRHQLAPMLEATKTLAQLATGGAFPHALPVAKSDEVGALIDGFNRLLCTLAQREDTLRLSEENLAITLHSISDAVIATDATGKVTQMNPTAERLTGWSLALATGRPLPEVFRIVNADTRQVCSNPVEMVMAHGEVVGLANHTVLLARDGLEYQIADSAAPIRDATGRISGVVLVFSDVSKKYQIEEALRANERELQIALKEKTSLLNEVHHRVKNNLQVITSLLRLEAGRSDQADTKAVLNEMQGRIRSMALLHETLYRSGIFASADLALYLRELAIQAFRAQASCGTVIELKLDLAPVTVSMDKATPCGLMVNELISNCLKHGFPDGRSGEVVLVLKLIEDTNQALLSVSDNGIGLPPDFESKRESSLGLQLASDLARQIGGALEIQAGSVFSVAFPVTD